MVPPHTDSRITAPCRTEQPTLVGQVVGTCEADRSAYSLIFVPLIVERILYNTNIMAISQRSIVINYAVEVIFECNTLRFQESLVLNEWTHVQVHKWKLNRVVLLSVSISYFSETFQLDG